MEKVTVDQLYHLSRENHDGDIFIPRIPADKDVYEDSETRRICFSTTLEGAFKAICEFYYEHKYPLYVHVPERMPANVWQPNEHEVYDVNKTQEKWVRQNVKMKCIGIAMFEGIDYSKNEDVPESVKINWIEKF